MSRAVTLHPCHPEDGEGTGDYIEITMRGWLRVNARVWCSHCHESWPCECAPSCTCTPWVQWRAP